MTPGALQKLTSDSVTSLLLAEHVTIAADAAYEQWLKNTCRVASAQSYAAFMGGIGAGMRIATSDLIKELDK